MARSETTISLLWVATVVFGLMGPVLYAERGPNGPVVSQGDTELRERFRTGVHMAGSGSNVSLTRALVSAYEASLDSPNPHTFTVHESIGSSGGLRALADGAVDVALVSREVTDSEAGGLVVIPYARTAVVVAVHPSVPATQLGRTELERIYDGENTAWHDDLPAVPVLREASDSSHLALRRSWPEFLRANERARERGRFFMAVTDQSMINVLRETPGAIGLTDFGVVRSTGGALRVVAVDGQVPTLNAVGEGSYPFIKTLSFVVREPINPRIQSFLSWIQSDDAKSVLLRAGYVAP